MPALEATPSADGDADDRAESPTLDHPGIQEGTETSAQDDLPGCLLPYIPHKKGVGKKKYLKQLTNI